MKEKIIWVQNDKEEDLTHLAGGITLTTTIDTLGASLSFDLARNFEDKNFILTEKLEVGNFIKFLGENKQLFSGIIIDVSIDNFKKSFKCLDFYFYLNKNKIIKQFIKTGASLAIKKMIEELGGSTGIIENIATSITKIYKNNTVAEIITDILEQAKNETGKKYVLEIENSKFNLIQYKKIKIDRIYLFTGPITATESIVNMKNSIIVTSNNQDAVNILGTSKDENSIKKYGMLQDIIEVDPKDVSKVRNIAQTKLKELNKIIKNASFDVLGNDEMRAGRLLEVNDIKFGLNGNYLIKNCSHKYEKNNHIVSIEIEVT